MQHALMSQTRVLTLAAAVAAAFALTACDRNDNRTVGQKLDSAVATAEQKTQEAKTEVKQEMADAKAKSEVAADKMATKMESASEKVGDKVQDAVITASVNAELARDEKLSALKINVDTVDGHVSLRGTAPDATARERATRLAAAVKGVTKVDNQLEVRG